MTAARVLDALTASRDPFVRELHESLRGFHVTGVTGEAEVGKTAMVDAAVHRRPDLRQVRLDLDATYSPNRLVWQWARALARTTMGRVAFSHVDELARDLWPGRTRSELALLGDHFGPDIARLVEQPFPDPGIGTLDAVAELMHATITLAGEEQVVLVIDHLEAPSLAFRHPLNVDELLWHVRSAAQHAVDLHMVLIARPPAVELATAESAAFYGDGQWLSLQRPSASQFAEATERPVELVAEVMRYTAGHVASTLAVLERHRPSRRVHATVSELADDHRTLADRTLQHARSVHRLGGHLVRATAAGAGPYEASPDARSKEVSTAMRQLHLAGIVRRPSDVHQGWELTDPRVVWVLMGTPAPIRP